MKDIVIPYPFSELKPGKFVGSFKVVEVYPEGRGGMSRVVRAKSKELTEIEVALKISRTGQNQEYYFAADRRGSHDGGDA